MNFYVYGGGQVHLYITDSISLKGNSSIKTDGDTHLFLYYNKSDTINFRGTPSSNIVLYAPNATVDYAENQYETRMPADFIAKRIRYANSIEILSDVPEDTPSNAHEIFIDSGELKYREGGSEAVLIGTQGVTDYSLEMSRKSGTSNVIQYTIGKAGTDKYDLVTDVVILNLESKGITGPDQGIGVRFYTDAAENVTPVSIVSLVNPPAQYTSVDAPVALPFG